MPIYAMQCDACGKEQDIYRTVARMDEEKPHCCGVEMRRKICRPYVITDIQPYQSMVDGSMIGSRSKHREHLKAHGMIEVGNEQPVQPKPKEVNREEIRKELHQTLTHYGL